MHARMLKYVGRVNRGVRRDLFVAHRGKRSVCVCARALACELIVEVYYQRVVPPVKGGEKMKETKEAHLRRTEKYREIALCTVL